MKKMCKDRLIEVIMVTEIETSWGWTYGLYKSGSKYYAQECDDDKYIFDFGGHASDEEAINAFNEYMAELEKENADA